MVPVEDLIVGQDKPGLDNFLAVSEEEEVVIRGGDGIDLQHQIVVAVEEDVLRPEMQLMPKRV